MLGSRQTGFVRISWCILCNQLVCPTNAADRIGF